MKIVEVKTIFMSNESKFEDPNYNDLPIFYNLTDDFDEWYDLLVKDYNEGYINEIFNKDLTFELLKPLVHKKYAIDQTIIYYKKTYTTKSITGYIQEISEFIKNNPLIIPYRICASNFRYFEVL